VDALAGIGLMDEHARKILAPWTALDFREFHAGNGMVAGGPRLRQLERVPTPQNARTMPPAPRHRQDVATAEPDRRGDVGSVAASASQAEDFEARLMPLWQRAQAGDEAAYRQALERIAARLRGYLRRRLQGLPDEVEDLVQETLLALHLQRGTYDPALPVSAWVLAIARHKLVDLWRRRGRREALHDPLDDVDDAALVQPETESTAPRDLGVLLGSLPAAQRAAIVLTKIDGLSVAEAAQRTGASESAIKVQVHRGLKKLAQRVRQMT
jgi:RNA polymerase sigma-70 factor (ECF subfamily)